MGNCCWPSRPTDDRYSKTRGVKGSGSTQQANARIHNENHGPSSAPPAVNNIVNRSRVKNLSRSNVDLVSVRLYNDDSPSECPFCNTPGMDISDMIIVLSETVPHDMFERLMERGWWRTGNVVFKPQLARVCCPSFAIRLPVDKFELTKSHRRVLNIWKNFLIRGDPRWDNRPTKTNGQSSQAGTQEKAGSEDVEKGSGDELGTESHESVSNGPLLPVVKSTKPESSVAESGRKKVVRPGQGADPSRPPCRKAKVLRAEKLQEKREREKTQGGSSVGHAGLSSTSGKPHQHQKKSLLELMKEHEDEVQASSPLHRLEVKLLCCSPADPEIQATNPEFFALYQRFQDGVHPGKSKFKNLHDLNWGFVSSIVRHGSDPDRPLGTYHMRYYLDGELVMISLVDILPSYFVSVYFMYDPDLRFLQPGIYTCLREIAFIQQLQKKDPQMTYYNLGFFNESNPKISYKKQFKPTEILCPITNVYVPLESAVPILKESKYARFAGEDVKERPKSTTLDVDELVMLDSTLSMVHVRDLPTARKRDLQPMLQRYVYEAGKDIMQQMYISH